MRKKRARRTALGQAHQAVKILAELLPQLATPRPQHHRRRIQQARHRPDAPQRLLLINHQTKSC